MDEINIVNLETCSQPEKFAKMKAEPEWKILGKRLGKEMPPVAKAISELGAEQIAELEKSGKLMICGKEVLAEEVKVCLSIILIGCALLLIDSIQVSEWNALRFGTNVFIIVIPMTGLTCLTLVSCGLNLHVIVNQPCVCTLYAVNPMT